MANQEIENLQEQINWHWRNTMRPVRFFAFDARAALPLPVLFFYMRPSTLALTFLTLLFFRFLERKGLTVPAAMRTFRSWLVGRERPAWISAQRKRFTTFE